MIFMWLQVIRGLGAAADRDAISVGEVENRTDGQDEMENVGTAGIEL